MPRERHRNSEPVIVAKARLRKELGLSFVSADSIMKVGLCIQPAETQMPRVDNLFKQHRCEVVNVRRSEARIMEGL